MPRVMLDLAIILAAAFAGGLLVRRFGYPAALGELAVGMLIGPSALGYVEYSEPLVLFAELGGIVLLFYVGLETELDRLAKSFVPSLAAGVLGAVAPLFLGFYGGRLLGLADGEALFMGTVMTATSIGITVRLLSDLGKLHTKEGMAVLGAAVVDDVVAILLLSITLGILMGEISLQATVVTVAKAIGFWIVILVVAGKLLVGLLNKWKVDVESLTILIVALGFAAASVSAEIGMSTIIGAFAIGVALSRMDRAEEVVQKAYSLYIVFVPILFVSIGMLIDVRAFLTGFLPGLVITLLAVVSKIVGCGTPLLFLGYSKREALRVGVGMIPRGEMGLIVAGLGLASGFLSNQVYSMAVMMVALTTVIALPSLRWLYEH